jgi:hypothetical protein
MQMDYQAPGLQLPNHPILLPTRTNYGCPDPIAHVTLYTNARKPLYVATNFGFICSQSRCFLFQPGRQRVPLRIPFPTDLPPHT